MSHNQYGNPYSNPYGYNDTNHAPHSHNSYGPPSAALPSPQYGQSVASQQQYHAQQAPYAQQAQYVQHQGFGNDTVNGLRPTHHHQQQQSQQSHSYNQHQSANVAVSPQYPPSQNYEPSSDASRRLSTQSYNQYAPQTGSHMYAQYGQNYQTAISAQNAWQTDPYASNTSYNTAPQTQTAYSGNHANTGVQAGRANSMTSPYNNLTVEPARHQFGASPVQSATALSPYPKTAVAAAAPSPSLQHSQNQYSSAQSYGAAEAQALNQVSNSSSVRFDDFAAGAITPSHIATNISSAVSPAMLSNASLPAPVGLNSGTDPGYVAKSVAGVNALLNTNNGVLPSPLQNHRASPSQNLTAPTVGSVENGAKVSPKVSSTKVSKTGKADAAIRKHAGDKDDVAYDMLLISLSDEYIAAAHKLGPHVVLTGDKAELETYNGLIAAGLCCLEAALANFSFPARLEAAVTFRYATLLLQETENHEQLEKIISKAILRCDRGKLLDFKYSFYHLLARASFRRNPKAALRALDNHISEVDGHKNTPWLYALRLLRITLSLNAASNHDLSIALQHLALLITLAERNKDFCMVVMLAALEALVHLKTSAEDYVINCQESIAKARSLQMRKGTEDLKQIWAMLGCVDLICSILECNTKEIPVKVLEAHNQIEDLVLNTKSWTKDGSVAVPLGETSTKQVADLTSGIFKLNKDGQLIMSIQWLDSSGAYSFAFLLSSIASISKNAGDEKNLKYIRGGLEFLQSQSQSKKLPLNASASRALVHESSKRNASLQWYSRLYETFLFCIRTDWNRARKALRGLRSIVEQQNLDDEDISQRWVKYLQGTIEQGMGNLEAATGIFRSLVAQDDTKPGTSANRSTVHAKDDLPVLSRINLLLLLRSPSDAPSSEAQQILLELQEMVPSTHRNAALRTAVALISAVLNPREAIARTKGALKTALQASRSSGSAHLLAVSMTAMVSIFFTDITVGEQAQRSRSVALELTQRAGDPLWIAVACGMALQGELDGEVIKTRHEQLDKAIDSMDEGARKIFQLSLTGPMDED